MHIREASALDLNEVLFIEREAFGHGKEAGLVNDLLNDPTAEPILSLLAFDNDRPAGHILFTRVRLLGVDQSPSMSILAPLAVLADFKNQGIGGRLIDEGIRILAESGVELVFVLGHPGYYPRHGFKQPAGALGFEAPYPIPDEHADAWMVQELRSNVIGRVSGKIVCADALNKPEHWRE